MGSETRGMCEKVECGNVIPIPIKRVILATIILNNGVRPLQHRLFQNTAMHCLELTAEMATGSVSKFFNM